MLNPLIGKDSLKQLQTLSFLSKAYGAAQIISNVASCFQIDLRISNNPLRWINIEGTRVPFTLLEPPSELVNITFIADYLRQIQVFRNDCITNITIFQSSSINSAIVVRDKNLGEALQYIIPQKRAVILLSYFVGYNNTEVANILGVSPTSIARRKKSAFLRLRELLEVRVNDE